MGISVELLSCGSLSAPTSFFEQGASDEVSVLPVPAWLIRHPKGLVLFDTGMHKDLLEPGELLDTVELFFSLDIGPDAMVEAQLNERQVGADDIDIVVLSHLHFDHSGGLAQIPNARVLVQQADWDAGLDDEASAANAFRREDYDLGHDVVALSGEHDVFGDGSVMCLPTPGHTPGHQSLQVKLDSETVVLCADCAYFERTLHGGALPPLGFSDDQQHQSIAKLQALGAAGAHLIPGHDEAYLKNLEPKLV